MPDAIFVSYRRLDSQHAAFAITDRLRWAFGKDEVFFDRGSIASGSEWPAELRRGLASARVLIVVIGKTWLRTADTWGRRCIDKPDDWVRQEVQAGLDRCQDKQLAIIPLLLDDTPRLRAEGLDPPLNALAAIEPAPLRDDHWEDDLEHLIELVAAKTGMQRSAGPERNPNGSPARPPKGQGHRAPLSDADVRVLLEPLARWQLQWNAHPWGMGGRAQEIAKTYDFDSFLDAVAFMAFAAQEVQNAFPPAHHPRWENQWKVVNVFFTTWDVNCRVTELDIRSAQDFDRIHSDWQRQRPRP